MSTDEKFNRAELIFNRESEDSPLKRGDVVPVGTVDDSHSMMDLVAPGQTRQSPGIVWKVKSSCYGRYWEHRVEVRAYMTIAS